MKLFFILLALFLFSGKVYSQTADTTRIGIVKASDPNTGQILTYQIIEGNEDNTFYLHPTTGMLYWNKPKWQIVVKEYILTVKVTDNGIPPLSSSAKVKVQYTKNEKY